MKKILEVDASSGIGGGQKVLYDIITGLKDKYLFQVASPAGIYSDRYSERGICFHELRGSLPVLSLRRIIKKESPDVLHAHGTRAAFWARIAVIGLRKKPVVVYTLHGLHIIRRKGFMRSVLLFFERFLNRWTDRLVCVSESDRKLVLDYRTIEESKIVMIRNGIDVKEYVVNDEAIRRIKKELNLEGRLVLNAIGRLHPPKDYSTVLRALKILISKDPRFVLLISGDGPLRKSLEDETAALGLTDHVKFLGFREDIPEIINASDIVILSSQWEALGIVCLEAGACRKAVVASDIDGIREAVRDQNTGLLFRKGSAEDLAEKITRVISSDPLREYMGNIGYAFVSENYSKKDMLEGYKDLYNRGDIRV